MILAQVLEVAARGQEEGVPAWVLALLFACQALVAVAFSLMAYLGAKERLPRNAFFGLRTARSRASDTAWKHVHRVSAPYSWAAAAVVVAGGVVMALTTGSEGGFLAALLLSYLVACALVLLGMQRGHRDLPAG